VIEQLREEHLLWYLNRGAGIVLVAVLTVATALGVLATSRSASSAWPRFATQALHRNLSLLATVLVVVHAGTAVLDTYVSAYVTITPLDAVVPFVSGYERVWLGIGVLASDLMIAVVVTSLLRHRMSHGAWRLVHLASYAAWALGVLHGVLVGTDESTTWALAVYAGSVAVVVVAGVLRVSYLARERRVGW
jgi:sulfoxide reductase heme-binding subunit YedZ